MKFYIKVEGVNVPVYPIGRYNNTVYIKITGIDTKNVHDLSVHIHDLYTDTGKATKDIINQYFSNEYKD